jgi:uncharacterized membrane protein YqhA
MMPEKYNEHIRTVILNVYKGEMVDVLLLLTFNTVVSWAPYALLDYILYAYTDLTISVINNIDVVIIVFVLFLIGKFSKKFSEWYSNLKKKQEEEQEALLNRATELDEVRGSQNDTVTNKLHDNNTV